MNLFKTSILMFKETSRTIRTVILLVELFTAFAFILFVANISLDGHELEASMSKLTLISVPAWTLLYPVLTHFGLILRLVYLLTICSLQGCLFLLILVVFSRIPWFIFSNHGGLSLILIPWLSTNLDLILIHILSISSIVHIGIDVGVG